MAKRVGNLVGKRFGNLIVREFVGKDKYYNKLWRCECDCKNMVVLHYVSSAFVYIFCLTGSAASAVSFLCIIRSSFSSSSLEMKGLNVLSNRVIFSIFRL